jgi:hypothetical protein
VSTPEPERLTAEERAVRRLARKRRLRRRRLALLALVLGAAGLAAGVAAWAGGGSTPSAARAQPPTVAEKPCRPVRARPEVIHPAWETTHRATILVDSVLLGGVSAVRSNFRRWSIDVIGHPAIMLPAMDETLRSSGQLLAPLVIVGIGYNSLWEKNRHNYRIWAKRFDDEANTLLRTVKRLGAKQVVWVTLRAARRSVIPSSALWQYDKYSWYFPYVNEQLRRLDRRRSDLVLADWAAVSNRSGITYDAIHLDPDGAALMARTIRAAVEAAAKEETRVIRPPAKGCTAPH